MLSLATDRLAHSTDVEIATEIICSGLLPHLLWHSPELLGALQTSCIETIETLANVPQTIETCGLQNFDVELFSLPHSFAQSDCIVSQEQSILPQDSALCRNVMDPCTHERISALFIAILSDIVTVAPYEGLCTSLRSSSVQALILHLYVGALSTKQASAKALAALASEGFLSSAFCAEISSAALAAVRDLLLNDHHLLAPVGYESVLVDCLAFTRHECIPGVASYGRVEKCVKCLQNATQSTSTRLQIELCKTLYDTLGIENGYVTSPDLARQLLSKMQSLSHRTAESLLAACIVSAQHAKDVHGNARSQSDVCDIPRPWKARRVSQSSSEKILGWNLCSELADLLPAIESEDISGCANALVTMRPLARVAAHCDVDEIERDFFQKVDSILLQLEGADKESSTEDLVVGISCVTDILSTLSYESIRQRPSGLLEASLQLLAQQPCDEDACVVALKHHAVGDVKGKHRDRFFQLLAESLNSLKTSGRWATAFACLAPVMLLSGDISRESASICRAHVASLIEQQSCETQLLCIKSVPPLIFAAKLRGIADSQWAIKKACQLVNMIDCEEYRDMSGACDELHQELEKLLFSLDEESANFNIGELAQSLESRLQCGTSMVAEATIRCTAALFVNLEGSEIGDCRALAEAALRSASTQRNSLRATVLEHAAAFANAKVLERLFATEEEPGYLCLLRTMRTMLDAASDVVAKSDVLDLFSRVAHEAQHYTVFEITLSVLLGAIGCQERRMQASASDAFLRLTKREESSIEGLLCYSPHLMEIIGFNLVDHPNQFEAIASIEPHFGRRQLALLVLPHSVTSAASQERSDLLQAFASELGVGPEKVVYDFGYYAVADIMIGHQDVSQEGVERCKNFLSYQIGISLPEYIAEKFNSLMENVLEKASLSATDVHYETVAAIADQIHPKIQSMATLKGEATQDVPTLLQPIVLQSLYRLLRPIEDVSNDPESLRSAVTTHALTRALFSVCLLSFLLGPKLAAYVHHIRPILARALDFQALQTTGLQALRTFVYALAYNAPHELENVAEQIVVAALPSLEVMSDASFGRSVELLHELIVNNGERITHCMSRLPVLPEHEDLREINRIVENQRGSLSFSDRIDVIVDSLDHESIAVKGVSLRELIRLLQENRNEVTVMIEQDSARVRQSMGRLIRSVLKCCAEEGTTKLSTRVQMRAADALANIGALDPHRISFDRREVDKVELHVRVLGRRLLCEHVVRVMRGTNDFKSLLNALYAAQEILRYFGCRSSDDAKVQAYEMPNDALAFWQWLPEDVRKAIEPCLSSRYVITGSSPLSSTPIINEDSISFKGWLSQWCMYLRTWIVSDESQLVDACAGLLLYDIPSALFLLPHLIMLALRNGGDDAIYEIQNEISQVLNHAAQMIQTDKRGGTMLQGKLALATQAIFGTLDKLYRFTQDHNPQEDADASDADETSIFVEKLLAAVPDELLARAAFSAGAVARAHQHYEKHLRKRGTVNEARDSNMKAHNGEISFLSTIAHALEEEDMVVGFERMRAQPTTSDIARRHEQASEWHDALTIYENQLTTSSDAFDEAMSGRMRCLWGLGYYQEIIRDSESALIATRVVNDMNEVLREYGAAAAWRLGDWERIDLVANDSVYSSLEETFAFNMQSAHNGDRAVFQLQQERMYTQILSPLAAAGMEESYRRAYPLIMKLHALKDVEAVLDVQNKNTNTKHADRAEDVLSWIDERKQLAQRSLHTMEPLLSSHRTLYSLIGNQQLASRTWLELAKHCRQSGEHHAAQSSLLHAERSSVSCIATSVEKAKLIWRLDPSRQHRALSELESALKAADESAAHDLLYKAKLRLARWSHELGTKHKGEIHELYREVMKARSTWEKSKFYYAKFMDDLLRYEVQHGGDGTSRKASKHNRYGECLTEALRSYGESLQQGHKHIYESLPRILTLWFDYTENATTSESPHSNRRELRRVLDAVKEIVTKLPTYQWTVVLPQLVSRICHPHDATATTVKNLLKKLMMMFPQQTLWALTAATRSKTQARSQAGSEVLRLVCGDKSTSEGTKSLISDFSRLTDQLVTLCYFTGREANSKIKSFSITKEFSTLKRMLPSPVIVPVQKNFAFQLPDDGKTKTGNNPFPADKQTIAQLEDNVAVLSSLQKPKKLTVVGSDGSKETFLCKPKDDLRKDLRMMEFSTLLNRIFSREHDSRRRNLHLRTFAVTPLSEDCGILEWVRNTRGLRHILQDLYAAEGKFDKTETNKQLNLLECICMLSRREYDRFSESELGVWYQKLLRLFPPILHKFFMKTFPEPSLWIAARNRFSRSAAAWSMVGHIVGLGDRHGENILLDSSTGDAVHVDFSCLFDKGLDLERPELVPFRLTQNMIDGFGVSGCEGIFFQSSHICLRVLRAYKDSLMAVLDTFVHDPLVEWAKAQERGNESKPRVALSSISRRLAGVVVGVGAAPSPALSPQGQARRLISEASSQENLSKMFIWWQPWM